MPLDPQYGLRLFDAASSARTARLMIAPLDLAALRMHATSLATSSLFAGLIRMPTHHAAERSSLLRRLAKAAKAERGSIVEGAVLREVATVLGHSSASQIDPSRSFSELGFDSLGAVELQNRLRRVTEVRLAPTMIFDYPTPAELLEHVKSEIDIPFRSPVTVDPAEPELREALMSIPAERLRQAGLLDPLLRLSRGGDIGPVADDEEGAIDTMDAASLVQKAFHDAGVEGPADAEGTSS